MEITREKKNGNIQVYNSIVELFEEQVQQNPYSIAIEQDGNQLTYQELNNKANQVADMLIKNGVEPNQFVGTYMNRSLDLIVAWLGILKAGGAYVPLDIEYPKERIKYMIEDSNVSIILFSEKYKNQLRNINEKIKLFNCSNLDGISFNPANKSTSENLAYLIYTSGSTGKPKGVSVIQKGVVRLVLNTNYVDIKPIKRIAQISNSSFDAVTFEVWGALLNGATLVIAPHDVILSPNDFKQWLLLNKITTVCITTSLFNQVARLCPSAFREVDEVLIGGEACSPQLVKRVLETDPPRRLLNAYGPTESTTYALCYNIESVAENSTNIPIGKPISNTSVYILDNNMQIVPKGVPGELYIGGDGLARGYWNRPELTNEKFVANPFSSDPKERLYKTGDIVKCLADGNIEYVGRIDNQVKLRGYRIELGEIEETLKQHEVIKDAKVIIREDEPGDKRLVGYVISSEKLSNNVWIGYLKGRLPEYMVPSTLVYLETFPLTPNGKIDYSSLPMPQSTDYILDDYTPPSSLIEKSVAEIWKNVLRIENLGIHNNFFELGGHSLLVTQVISRINKEMNINLPLRVLFEHNTIAKFAHYIETAHHDYNKINSHVEIKNISKEKEALPLSFSQQRLWFLDQLDSGNSAYNVPIVLQVNGALNYKALKQAVSKIITRHEILRTSFKVIGEKAIQWIHPSKDMDIPILQFENEEEIMQVIEQKVWEPFDLEKGPLFRAELICQAEDQHILCMCIHHIIFDGWSRDIFLKELTELYEHYSKGKEHSLKKLPIQYADFSYWQRDWLKGEELNRQLSYWKNKLAGDLPILQLPTDFPRPAKQTFNGDSYTFEIPNDLTQKLKDLSKREGVTLYMTLLAAYKVLLYRYTGQKDILVGTPIAGRNREELEELIGFFVNTLVIRTDLSENPDFMDYLKQVREACLEAYSHQDVPFEKLVEELQPERNQSVTPLFQTMFSFQSIKPKNLTLTDIELSSFELDTKLTKFDMSLNVNEYNDLLLFEFQYNSDLFSGSTVKKMTNHYLNLLNSLVNNQYSSIASAQMLDESELKQLVVNWGPKPESRTNKIFYSYIDQYLENSPETIAVKSNNEEMTYRQLIYQSNKVANFLKDRKVPKGTQIGVSMEKSVILIPLVIGIMKAGCVYVPLEPTNAKERLSFIINDVGIELIFTQEKWAELFDGVNGIRVLSIDKEWCLIENKEIHLNNNVSLEDLAYILYTSGTTGTPKGVMITHKNIASAYPSWEKAYKLSSFKNCLQMASLAFDVFISDMVKTLCSGGTLVLCSKEDTIDPQALYGIMTKEQIHFAEFVPAVLKQFVSYLEQEGKKLEDLKLIISGSDTWYASDYKWIKSIIGADVKLINSYGITETTIDNIIFDESNLNINNEIVPIGRPFEHVGTYILDENLQIVPIGVSGEIYISGPAVSAGYLNRDDLTLQRFIDNPYSEYKEHSILYKTGDQARYLSDGNIEFLGRKDKQVKIRGFRIEINEIEFILRQHKDIREGVVRLYNSTHLKDQLIAYVVLNKPGIQIDIKDYLKERLPHYMIPTHIIFLDKIPLNTNGKIDYNSLPKLEERIVNESLSTKTPVEEKISMIWKDLLGIEQIGANDNFFELGGHSLLATQVRSRMQTAFHINIPLRYLFEMPILKEISIEVERLVIEQVESLTEKEIEELLALIK